MLTCYLDDSGEASEPIVTLAGYVSLTSEWAAFETKARAYFDANDISCLHTVDFHHGHGQFTGWDRARRRAFAIGLYDILAEHTGIGFEVSILKKTYGARREQLRLNQSVSPIGGCFQILLTRITNDEGIADVLTEPDAHLTFVVEAGNANNGNIENIFQRAKSHQRNNEWPVLRSLSFAHKEDFVALQVSDFLAYYARRFRVRGSAAKHAELEMNLFNEVTNAIRHNHVVATDFGG